MANLSNFPITVVLSGSVANPINSSSFQIVTPWGQTAVCNGLGGFREALYELIGGKGGTEFTGAMGSYFSSQTLNGATGSGPTAFTSANTWGSNI